MNILQTIYARVLAETPQFFKVIKYVGLLVAAVTGLPGLLEQYGISLPPNLQMVESKTVAIASIVGAIISQLTVSTPVSTTNTLNDTIKNK